MVTIKSAEEIKDLRVGGKILAVVLRRLAKACRPGVSAKELDSITERLLAKHKVTPSFKDYRPNASGRPFPASLCVSVNSVVVHGIPSSEINFRSGDIVSLDLGVIYKNLFTDGAITVGVGKTSHEMKSMMSVAKAALEVGVKVAKVGNTLGDVGSTIQRYVAKHGFTMVQGLGGHGVGYGVHEDPFVSNFGEPDTGLTLREGMVLAIEPMVTSGSGEILHRQDGSFITKDGAPAAHFEHTVAIIKKRPLVLTK